MRVPEAEFCVQKTNDGKLYINVNTSDVHRSTAPLHDIASGYSDDLRDLINTFDKVDIVEIGRVQDFTQTVPVKQLGDDDFTRSDGVKLVSSFEVAPNGTVFHGTNFYNENDPNCPEFHRYAVYEMDPAVLVYADDDKNIEHLYDDSHEFHSEIDGEPRKQIKDFYESKDYRFDTDFIRHSRQNGLFKLLKEKMAHDPNPEEADFRWAEQRATAFAIGKSGEQILMD